MKTRDDFLLLFKCERKNLKGDNASADFGTRIDNEAHKEGIKGFFHCTEKQCLALFSGNSDAVIAMVERLLSRSEIGAIEVVYEGCSGGSTDLPQVMDQLLRPSLKLPTDKLDVQSFLALSTRRDAATLLN